MWLLADAVLIPIDTVIKKNPQGAETTSADERK